MKDDQAVAAPSLLWAGTEKAHREHLHQHNLFHKNRRQTETQVDIQQIVTEVVQTVSYIQQIDVDSDGSTFAIQTILASPTGTPATTDSPSAATITDSASPGVTNTASSAPSTAVGITPPDASSISQSLLFNSTSTLPSASSIPTSSFALLTVSSNSTTLISGSSSQIRTFSNSTLTSSSSVVSSSSDLTSSSSSSFDISSTYSPSSSSTSLSYLSSVLNVTPTASAGNGGTAGATGAATGSTSTSTAAAGDGNSSGSSTVSTGSVVGGVVGGVAGAAILVFFLMAFLRWKKRHQDMFLLGSGDPGSGSGGGTSRAIEPPPPTQPSGGMSGPRTSLFAVPAALASLTGFKRNSAQAPPTDVVGERGFYRVSGRKLPSVLQSGGDGYGDGMVDNTLSGSSFYRDSQGFYGGPGSPTLAPPVGTQRPESGIPVMRPSPARTPVTEHGPFGFGPAPLTPPHRPDVVGRSLPSQDGSHASRFTEEV